MTRAELKEMVQHYGKDKTLELLRMTIEAQAQTIKELERERDAIMRVVMR